MNRKILQIIILSFLVACAPSGRKKSQPINMEKGTYGYDHAFLSENNVETIELKSESSEARVLIAPGYQGRVMTSSANGDIGSSFGWINYDLIESGEVNDQFNPVGGEERFWLGPEGGPFSVYFEQGEEQVFENWNVSAVIDTEEFEIKEKEGDSVTFGKTAKLKNASGTEFDIAIERKVKLLSTDEAGRFLGTDLSGDSTKVVAYQSDNILKNTGKEAWTKESGLLSIWMLCMFNPSPSITVFIPYNPGPKGKIVNDDYFGKVPPDRLVVDEKSATIFFKIDGAYRSKIGVPRDRASEICGSYDSATNVLTLLWTSLPSEPKEYVNSKWGEQDDPYNGDVINSYNDGPVEDGSVMGPFYEIETSSPAADLKPGEAITHTQRVIHIQGPEAKIAPIVSKLFGLDLNTVKTIFQ
ncbi:hypothetical protein GM418_27255 [Maribellus comscasis]|uniref:Lipoprotein n=1 Tax=Maribellus comscasis TaxID=2681766 RepID=A0A6I6K1B3_9BACT|nr:DUF6786 family protein [Maribellus comscasis]QGY47228.1 hypothetical protein GM418_27255 [Maribellus comscasis]